MVFWFRSLTVIMGTFVKAVGIVIFEVAVVLLRCWAIMAGSGIEVLCFVDLEVRVVVSLFSALIISTGGTAVEAV